MQAARIFAVAISKVLDQSLPVTEFKIVNIVATSDCGFSVRLEGLVEEHRKFASCHYEPELFPGLIYKMETPKVVLLVFTSGKVVLAGAKNRKDVYQAYQKIYPVLN
jgi:transcription initiation factor TFIID TATA-box-binding protein